MRIIFFLLSVCYLCGCQSFPPVYSLPLQPQTNDIFKVEQLDIEGNIKQINLLMIQYETKQWRWLMTDPLGTPLARVILNQTGWHNDGFVMPNQQARWLFSALATALTPTSPPFKLNNMELVGSDKQFTIKQKNMWQIQATLPIYNIQLADGSFWQIEKLN